MDCWYLLIEIISHNYFIDVSVVVIREKTFCLYVFVYYIILNLR